MDILRMAMRRISLLFLMLLISSSLFAAAWSFGNFMGVRYRSVSDSLVLYGLEASYDDLSFHFAGLGADDFTASLSYDADVGKTIHNTFILTTDSVPSEGGFATLGYLFSQHFAFSVFRFGYGFGIQGGVSYSPYSDLFYSLIPLFDLRLGIDTGYFIAELYSTMVHPDATEWKMAITSGLTVEVRSGNSSIFADGFFTLDNLLDVHTYLLSGFGVKVGYRYRSAV